MFTGTGLAACGSLNATCAGPCGLGKTASGPTGLPPGISIVNGVPQFEQNFASSEFCVPKRLQKITPSIMSVEYTRPEARCKAQVQQSAISNQQSAISNQQNIKFA